MVTTAAITVSVIGAAPSAQARVPSPYVSNVSNTVQVENGRGCVVGHYDTIVTESSAQLTRIDHQLNSLKNAPTGLVEDAYPVRGGDGTVGHVVDQIAVRNVPANGCNLGSVAQFQAARHADSSAALPSWAIGLLAALAQAGVYVSVTLLVTGVVAGVTGGGGSIIAPIVGGCFGGALSSLVGNKILGITKKSTVIGNAFGNCVTGALVGATIGRVLVALENWITTNAAVSAMRNQAIARVSPTVTAAIEYADAFLLGIIYRLHA